MGDLMNLVGILYACNLMAEQAPPSHKQAVSCVNVQDQVKIRFLTQTELNQLETASTKMRHQITLRGYKRFKEWERANTDLVQEMRKAERERLGLETES